MLETKQEHEKPNLQEDPRWQLIERIVTSPHLSKSARLCSFLQFVSEETLAGRGDQLNEQKIGVRVFERRIDYDSAEDNIVRSHASRLRQRLETYFLDQGRTESLRVSMLRGSYALQFEEAQVEVPSLKSSLPAEPPMQASPPLAASHRDPARAWQKWLILALIAALLAVSGLALFLWESRHSLLVNQRASLQSKSPVLHALWSEVFPADRRTLIIPADSTLVLYQNILGQPVDLHSYMNKSYMDGDPVYPWQTPHEIANLVAHRRLTSVADLEMTARLLRIPEAAAAPQQIRFARDLQLADLKESNAIIIGGQRADPWLSVFEPKLNFVITDDMGLQPNRGIHRMNSRIVNRSPRPGEQAVYGHEESADHKAYAVIALKPNLEENGVVLILAGTSIAGTEAAADFVTDPQLIEAALAQLFHQYGKIPPFEILLETTDLNGSAPQSQVLAMRVSP